MPVSNPFKLAKLTMRAYTTRERRSQGRALYPIWEAMFNPESYSRGYQIAYHKPLGLNTSSRPATYTFSLPSELKLRLLLDGTGVDEQTVAAALRTGPARALVGGAGVMPIDPAWTVKERVAKFLRLAVKVNGEIHEPNYLRVSWGDMTFDCRLGSLDVNYTAFARSGEPLRAELDVTFIGDVANEVRLADESWTSPDLTHKMIVKAGDTLPALTRAVYGSAEHYLLVARYNELDDFRELAPGRELLFPPLDALT
jgi:hypothetical protein